MLFSCDKLVEKAITEPEPVDLTIDIDGKKTEISSMRSMHNGKLYLPFARSASLLTADVIEISIPGFREGNLPRTKRGSNSALKRRH
jgi:hypothetical protein